MEPRSPIRVLVVTPLGRHGMGGIDRIMDCVAERLEEIKPKNLLVTFQVTRGQGHIAWSPFLVARVVLGLATHVFGRGPDVVHVNLSSHGSAYRKLLVCGASRFFGIPYVLHLHGSEFRDFWDGAGGALASAIRSMFAHASQVLVLGHAWHDYIRRKVPEIEDRIRILPNATPVGAERSNRTPGPVTILFLGRIGPRKGIPQLIDALTQLRGDPGWRAVIAGDGSVDALRAAIAERSLADRVRIPGWVDPAEVSALLGKADILVLPSFQENLPMSVIEGMANGLAVVTTPVGATPDIIKDEVTGLLVPAGDAKALRLALERLIGDPSLRAKLGAAARAFHKENLEINRYVDRLIDIWHSTATATRPLDT